ncbi:MAG: DUF3078 domain-containing protein [Chlorobi bacterium]|nr:DUF3078 domain-containing protein [Chlorobiota bacterium]
MRFITSLFLLFLFATSLFAQDGAAKVAAADTVSPWQSKGVLGFNLSQMAFSDWSQGGDDAMTYTFTGNFGLNYTGKVWNFKNSLKVAYGQTKLGSGDFITNDNEFYLESVIARKFGWAVDPFFSNIVRTQVAPGNEYSEGDPIRISDIFDPGYISQALGFTFDKNKTVKTRLGVALQETFTSKFPKYSDDPETLDELETFKLETGIESVTDVEYAFMDNMLFKSKLRLFTRFDDPAVWDVRWDNIISAKINKYFVVNLNILVVYEKSQSLRTQIKEALQLGVTYILF